jgi:hypothetical protein
MPQTGQELVDGYLEAGNLVEVIGTATREDGVTLLHVWDGETGAGPYLYRTRDQLVTEVETDPDD